MADLQMQLSEMRVRCCLSALADRERILIFHCQILAYHRCIPLDSYLKNPGGELKTSALVKVIVLPKGPSFVIWLHPKKLESFKGVDAMCPLMQIVDRSELWSWSYINDSGERSDQKSVIVRGLMLTWWASGWYHCCPAAGARAWPRSPPSTTSSPATTKWLIIRRLATKFQRLWFSRGRQRELKEEQAHNHKIISVSSAFQTLLYRSQGIRQEYTNARQANTQYPSLLWSYIGLNRSETI